MSDTASAVSLPSSIREQQQNCINNLLQMSVELVGDKCEMVSIATLGNTSEIIGTACGGNTLYSHAYGWPAYKLANIANIQFYTGP